MDTKPKGGQGNALGRKAFRSGRRCVPALDPHLMKYMKTMTAAARTLDLPEPGLLPILDAWLAGWAAENLKPGAVWIERTVTA